MRYLPLVPNHTDPDSWDGQRDFDLIWQGLPHRAWADRDSVHALHFPPSAWNRDLIQTVTEALATRIRPDFLVLKVQPSEGRQATANFFNTLEALLEATHSRGVKLALRPEAGAVEATASLLKEMRGEAVGFCWDGEHGEGLEAMSDRLFCALGKEGSDLAPLLRLGYRWNVALEASDVGTFLTQKAGFEVRFNPVLFPEAMPTHVMGRPVLPDEGVAFGQGLGGGRGR